MTLKILFIFMAMTTLSFANFVERPKLYTRKEMRKLSRIEFKQILDEANNALPTKKAYPPLAPGKTAVIHHHWKDTGAALHEIAQIVKVNKRHELSGLKFFKSCAKNEKVLTTFAAICLTHYSVFFKLNNKKLPLKKNFPKDVVELSSILIQ